MAAMDQLNEELARQMEKRRKALVRAAVPDDRCLLSALLTLTKAELDDIRYNLCVKGISSLKKQEMAEALAQSVVQFSRKWFVTIGDEQYRILSKVSESGGISGELDPDDVRIDYMRCMGILFCGSLEDRPVWYLPSEILDVFRAMDGEKYARAVALNDEVVRLVAGLLFYYGCASYERLYESVVKYLGAQALEFIDFMGIVINAGCWRSDIVNVETGMHYYTLMDPEALMDAQIARKDLDYRAFTYEEIYRAGEPNYIEETDAFKALAGFFMKEFSLPVTEAIDLVSELQIILLNGEKFSEMIDYVQSVVSIPNQAVAERMVALLTELNQTSRFWRLKGHSPKELAPGGEKAAAPCAVKTRRDNVVKFVPLSSRIGRNDACPCGSGKKYKKCCLDREIQ